MQQSSRLLDSVREAIRVRHDSPRAGEAIHWSSIDGAEWRLETDNPGWCPRVSPPSVVFEDRMRVLAGAENLYDHSLENGLEPRERIGTGPKNRTVSSEGD